MSAKKTENSPPPKQHGLVFLPGWGFDGRVFSLRDDEPLSCPSPSGLLDPVELPMEFGGWLDRQGFEQCEIIGWSLGGRCALELARRFPERVSAVHLLAVRAAWPADEIDAIRRELARQPVDFLRSFYRKCFLGYKEAYRCFQQMLEEKCLEQARRAPEVLERGLELLAAPMPEAAELPAGCRVYCLHGRRDVIAPVEQRLHWPGATSRVLEHGGHALFLDYYPAAGPHIPASSQAMIRRRFSRAAATYDANAEIQGQTLELLAGRLPPDQEVKSVLELGCGTGNWTRRLLDGLPRAHITALDFSEEMLRQAREKCPPSPRLELLCREGEDFLAANRQLFDLITANATLQWFADLPRSLAMIREALTPGGRLLTTIFGGQSLRELDAGLQAVTGGEIRAAARDFVDYPALQSMVTALFPAAIVEEYFLSRRFNDLGELLRHFRYTGTGGPGRPAAFTPRHYRELSRWFADQPHGFQISFQVFLVQAGKE
ncbi:alpha/beta fold hydrolase [Desulfurivibrio alkaliphilus]|uniref:Methyltransferase type 12 n=1 Tax=Desulfurivibrio alkaliphilus (strain DSM 19089 / UNIQEM U267 / AHT2) TaxID=589865 RepID=D6Z6C7_DESAT|nr:alpha/beta fold hydrolase [Desulfurivibrio alkaliphilus]ADH86892.1 Methyltransferase type 12 [Desulfurivibrio alkaliphilus AHT 2]